LQRPRSFAATIALLERLIWATPEDPMNNRDETIRDKLLDRLTAVGVDARNLAVEVANGTVIVRGTVPSQEQRQRAIDALIGVHSMEITIRPVESSDSDDGRGRSPITGTSAESAHQSRHQTDPT
jgi:BON domain-containing protein